MAIYHCSIKIGSRANGQSAIAAAAELSTAVSNLKKLLHVSMTFNGREFDCREADQALVGINLRRIDKKIEKLQLEVNAEQQRNQGNSIYFLKKKM